MTAPHKALFLLCSAAVFFIASCTQKTEEVPDVHKPDWQPSWFEPEHGVEYRKIQTRLSGRQVNTLSKRQARSDLEMLRYLLETSYAGYEYQKTQRGVDFDSNFQNAFQELDKLPGLRISRTDMLRLLIPVSRGVQDGHLMADRAYAPFTHEDYYYSDVIVEKHGEAYRVISPSDGNIKQGAEYTGAAAHLFKVFSTEGERYRLGTLSPSPAETLLLPFDGKTLNVPVRKDYPAYEYDDRIIHSSERGITYLRIPSFSAQSDSAIISENGKKRLQEVERHIRMLNRDNTVIIDVRNNTGGYTNTMALIPAILFTRQVQNFVPDIAELVSPGTAQAYLQNVWDLGDQSDTDRNTRRAAEIEAEKQKNSPRRAWNRGTLRTRAVKEIENARKVIIIINRWSMSASEILCAIRKVPGVTIIGENSAGIHTFANAQQYVLPHSQIPLMLPASILFDLSFSAGEGIGVLPDYWVTGAELESVLRELTGDEKFVLPSN